MPNIVHEVGLTAADYGIVVAAFGAAKLVANVPCAAIADSYGRRAAIVGGLTLSRRDTPHCLFLRVCWAWPPLAP